MVSEGLKKWVWFKYEWLPKFCSRCGIMGRTVQWCTDKRSEEPQLERASSMFGEWLRVGPPVLRQHEERGKP